LLPELGHQVGKWGTDAGVGDKDENYLPTPYTPYLPTATRPESLKFLTRLRLAVGSLISSGLSERVLELNVSRGDTVLDGEFASCSSG
jgi:hypothetical protein